MKALRGTGVALVEVLPLELPPLALAEVFRELELEPLAVWEAADPADVPDRILADPVLLDDDSADVELAFEIPLLVARFNTDEVAFKDEPLLLDEGVNRELPAAVAPAPAPDDEPAVFDAAAAVVPVCDD